jgi:Abortive infection alpha
MSSSWLQVANEALKIPSLLVEIYGDLARPGVRQVGKALETVIGLGNTALWPIAWANERSRIALERNLEKYREALESVPEEKIVPVAPEIGVPVAEKLQYVREDRLSDLYVRLLASASNVDRLSFAHPSFVNVINTYHLTKHC